MNPTELLTNRQTHRPTLTATLLRGKKSMSTEEYHNHQSPMQLEAGKCKLS